MNPLPKHPVIYDRILRFDATIRRYGPCQVSLDRHLREKGTEKMKERKTILLMPYVFFLAVVLAAAPAWAGRIMLYEIGTPDVGLASAGWAARAQDAATLFKNPTGMNLLPKSEFQAGIQAAYANLKFSPDSGTNVSEE